MVKMNRFKIINQINITSLTDNFTHSQIENALVNIFLKENNLKTKNRLMLEIFASENKRVTEKVRFFLISKKINLNLMTLEKFFELMIERQEKKRTGSFYTPCYIVNFMTENAIISDSKVLDPACGCGAFLLGSIKRLHKLTGKKIIEIIENNIYGVDISAKAIRRAKLIITLFAITSNEDVEIVNFNLLTADSLLLDWNKTFPKIFKEGGFDVVLENPPYAVLNGNYDHFQFKERYGVITNGSIKVNIYLLFLELMLKISKQYKGRGAAIIPLSLAFNSKAPFVNMRNALRNSAGYCKFSFYDRSPDSLFGDNIKTRNSIMFFEKDSIRHFSLSTTRLIRWNSREREKLFSGLVYQDMGDFPIGRGIPKISSSLELDILKQLESSGQRLEGFINITSLKDEIVNTVLKTKNNIYFYSTAYNWLSIFKEIPPSFNHHNERIIPVSLSVIDCKNQKNRDLIYAILNSKIFYWYWLVHGDGFHLTKRFVGQIPIDLELFSKKGESELIHLGNKLSKKVKKYPISKVNNNKSIGNYNILKCRDIIDQIDITIIHELRIDSIFLKFLTDMYKNHISAGRPQFKNSDNFIFANCKNKKGGF